jgi:hypothetical protein
MDSHIAVGVDGMFTNFPRRLENVLRDEAAPGSTGAALAADEFRSCVTTN